MPTYAHVDARFTADTSPYVRSVREAQKATENLARSLPSADGAMGNMKASTIALGAALGTLGAQALTKATGLVKQFAMQGIQAAKDYEQTVISIEGIFQGMGMSVEQATTETKGYLADLRDFAAETPFELPQTLDAVKRLLSIGYAADDVKDNLLPAIGDIVSALGQPASSISAVVYAFGQMKSAGRVLSQDLMQIGNALPGFNAKVAIAEQLFSGDMQAMAKAMESGSLDSETAIQAIIKAMQEFPGAAGAMERQSKTLAGVMSTFSDTVNNALIDGLMPSMPLLSEALMGVMPAVEAMATAFAQQLGPALIQGAKLLEAVVPIASALIPPIFELVDIFTGMSEILTMLAGPIIALADGLGVLIDLFNALPGPVKTAIAVLTTLWLLSKRYQVGWTTANGRVMASFVMMRTGVQTSVSLVQVSMLSGRVALEMFLVTARTVATGVVAAFRTVAVAARGLLTSLGPMGWALIGASVAFEVFSGRSAQTEELVSKLKDTVDETTGAFTRLTQAALAEQFRTDLSQEDVDTLRQLGISVDDAAYAIMKGGDAVAEFQAQIDAAQDTMSTGLLPNDAAALLTQFERNYQGAADAAEETARRQAAAAESKANAEYMAALEQMDANKMASVEYRRAALERRKADDETYASMNNLDYAHKNYADAAVRNQSRLTEVTLTTEGAVRALQGAYESLNTLISDVRAADRAYTALQEMKEQLKGNTEGIDEYTDAAMANRSSVLSYADAQIAYAQSLKNPQLELQALMDLEAEVKEGLKGQGIKPSESDLYQSIKGSIDAAKEAVGEMDTAVADAEARGLDVSAAIAAGITAGMSEQESALNAAGMFAGDTTGDAINAALGISSPSRVAMDAGRNTGLGLIEGLNQMRAAAEGAGMNIGGNIVRGMLTALRNGEGPIAAAARALVAAGIAAAKAESEEGSPSRVFMRIGDNIVAGLAVGIERTTPMAVDASTALIGSMRTSGEMAMEAMVSGMESQRSAVRASISSLSQEMQAVTPMVEGGYMVNVRAAMPTMGGGGDMQSGAGRGGGIHIENLNVQSAPGERADSSIPRQLRRMAWVAGLDG